MTKRFYQSGDESIDERRQAEARAERLHGLVEEILLLRLRLRELLQGRAELSAEEERRLLQTVNSLTRAVAVQARVAAEAKEARLDSLRQLITALFGEPEGDTR